MVKVDIINNSNNPDNALDGFSKEIAKRLESLDFEKFNISIITLHVIINADSESIRYTTSLSDGKKYLMYQGIPKEYAYNSSFEAKLSTIRLRIQNIDISAFSSEIDNIVFVVDFDNIESQSNSSSEDTETRTPQKPKFDLGKMFHRKNNPEDDEANRKATFIPIIPKYSLDNVIMTPEMKIQIDDALSIIKNRKKIYEEWGFSEIDPQPKAILSFWGPPGTGKTMCAHGIAHSMETKILAVNYAEIESKYAGESPKNLIAAFNAAQENNAILFFDEADSFLGKRISNVQSGHDQSINSLRSQMLIQLEDFEGVVIFATNLVKNFDKAFETRILRHIKFEMPDPSARAAIYKKMIPSKLPLEQHLEMADYEILAGASEGFSGRDIRNSVLDTLSSAARNGKKQLSLNDFLISIKQRQESYDKLKEEHNLENKKIAEDIKNSIIEKSKQDLNDALIGVAIYAAWSDGEMCVTEEKLIMELAKALGVSLPTGLELEYLPPLPHIIDYFNTNEKKYRAIDIAIRIVAVDGIFAEKEEKFISELFDMLRFEKDNVEEVLSYAHSLARLNAEWNMLIHEK